MKDHVVTAIFHVSSSVSQIGTMRCILAAYNYKRRSKIVAPIHGSWENAFTLFRFRLLNSFSFIFISIHRTAVTYCIDM